MNISTRIEKSTEIYIFRDNKHFYGFSLQGDDLVGITPEIPCVPRKNKIKTSDTLIIRKQLIQERGNPMKNRKEGSITNVEKASHKETPP